ncbi:pseudouridine synthase [Pichia kluyveri]|uniref:tRNA pseudouridine(55) synthase n=1 Tax=Pichia kluyveri TaxID=36015 RepID=A0AAV5R0K8_PICKL|nr:pseudouridine synthase [Pichia kluyveri]
MDGVFAINKPSGATSRTVLDQINRVLSKSSTSQESLKKLQNVRNQTLGKQRIKKWKTNKLKMGHGGTLDPLASGVLVIGVGSGTKKLGNYTNGSVKRYECVGLLGGSTTTGDSEGELLLKTEVDHVTRELLDKCKERMVGTLDQTPPIFSALKMDGKRLYDYAREGLPLPRQIKSREVTIHDLEIKDDTLSKEHDYIFLKSEVDETGKTISEQLANNPTLNDHEVPFSKEWKAKNSDNKELPLKMKIIEDKNAYEDESYRAPLLHFTSTVSSGTYIRSLLSDIGRCVGSSSYMVKLIRSKQAEWELNKNVFEMEDFTNYGEEVWAPVLFKVLESKSGNIDVRKEMENSIVLNHKEKKVEEETKENTEEEKETVDDEEQPPQKKQKV